MNKYMKNRKPQIIRNQKEFFNENATHEKPILSSSFFLEYVNKEQVDGFRWLGDSKSILDYGCGTGTTIEAFSKVNTVDTYTFTGVDIAEMAIKKVKLNFPNDIFFHIKNNKIPLLSDDSVDGAYLLHVLHHSYEHQEIFQVIHEKLKKGGKFLLNDLSSNNPFVKLSRSIFLFLPSFIKQRFADDLVVDGSIPDKYKVNSDEVVSTLREVGFTVEEIGYGHLFLFLFAWFDRFIPLSNYRVIRVLYSALWRFEQTLLKYSFFQKYAEVFYIKCKK